MGVVTDPQRSLPLTGERTVPGIAAENYWFRRHEAAYEWVVESFADDLRGCRVVDSGCGEGYGADLLARAGADVLGLELDQLAAVHASDRYRHGLAICQANLDALPVADEVVSALVSMQVIEHLWNLSGFLQETFRILRPGALCVLSTPNRLTFSPGLERGGKPTNPFHVEEFDADQLVDLMHAAGFVRVAMSGLRHGDELRRWEAEHGDIVAAQIAAAVGGGPSLTENPELAGAVWAINTADFQIDSAPLADCADLIVVARRPDRAQP
ncbi:MAG: methyltransferase domain-containing protein [Candidatus Nanopelagicales bacterium]